MTNPISLYLQERINAGDFPSASYLVGERGVPIVQGSLGNAVVVPNVISAADDTIYDLASLTKPVITGLLTAIFIERGMLSLDHRVSVYLGEFDVDGKRMITIRDLISHTSHLPAWRPLYMLTDDRSRVISLIGQMEVEFSTDAVVYGDPNFIVLGAILERLASCSLDELAAAEILKPLALKSTFFNPPATIQKRIAASEMGNGFEADACISAGFADAALSDDNLRKDLIWGVVHDGNAFFLGGVAGHAGLFSCSHDLFILAKQFLPSTSQLLSPETCSYFLQNLTPGMNEHRSLGFQLASTPGSTAGGQMPLESFGHLGFTGTSLWIDPVNERIFILLTNRTHMIEPPFVNINSVRRRFHDLAVSELGNSRAT